MTPWIWNVVEACSTILYAKYLSCLPFSYWKDAFLWFSFGYHANETCFNETCFNEIVSFVELQTRHMMFHDLRVIVSEEITTWRNVDNGRTNAQQATIASYPLEITSWYRAVKKHLVDLPKSNVKLYLQVSADLLTGGACWQTHRLGFSKWFLHLYKNMQQTLSRFFPLGHKQGIFITFGSETKCHILVFHRFYFLTAKNYNFLGLHLLKKFKFLSFAQSTFYEYDPLYERLTFASVTIIIMISIIILNQVTFSNFRPCERDVTWRRWWYTAVQGQRIPSR